MQRSSHSRYNTFHGPKQRLLGNNAGHVAPAWKPSNAAGPSGINGVKPRQITNPGSKILLSQLPSDVLEKDVEELFKKTVGPLRESFIVYNSQAKPKGMAVVHFQHAGDALVAKNKYDGKYIDGRRPIKIEIVTDSTVMPSIPSTAPKSLFERIEPSAPKPALSVANHNLPRQAAAAAQIAAGIPPPSGPRRRVKKGPKRLKKVQPSASSREQLDQEMEDYRALAEATS